MKKTVAAILITLAVTAVNSHYDEPKREDMPDILKDCKNWKSEFLIEEYMIFFENQDRQYTGSLLRKKKRLEEKLACPPDEYLNLKGELIKNNKRRSTYD